MTLAMAKVQGFEIEVRSRGAEGYLVIVRGEHYHRELTAPRRLRTGELGLSVAIDMVLLEIGERGHDEDC